MNRRPSARPTRTAALQPRHLLLGLAAVLAAGLGALLLLRSGSDDPMPEMAGMPFAFITVDAAGYDAGKVILWRGGSTPPRSLTVDGRTAWPAYLADPAVVPEKAGARWIFPMVEDGSGQHSSPLPPHGRVVGGSTPGFATPYVVPEAQAMLDRFRTARGG